MPRFDAIIVLGAAVWPDGEPGPTQLRRVERAVAAFRADQAPILVMTGGLGRFPPSEAEVMARTACERGVPAEAILLEDEALSTYDSACYCAVLMRRHGWRRVLLVTDGWHLPRTLLAFRAYGFDAEGASAGGGPGAIGWRSWLRRVAREAVAYLWYLWRLRGRLAMPRRSRTRP